MADITSTVTVDDRSNGTEFQGLDHVVVNFAAVGNADTYTHPVPIQFVASESVAATDDLSAFVSPASPTVVFFGNGSGADKAGRLHIWAAQ